MYKKLVASVGEDEAILNIGFDCTLVHGIPETRHEDNPSLAAEPFYETNVTWAELVINGEGLMLPTEYLKKAKVNQQLNIIVDEQVDSLFNQ